MMIHIYFQHDTLTPGNIRAVWLAAPQCPAVGETVRGEFGRNGAGVVWTVRQVEWIGGVEGRSATCYMTGPEQ
jgi:hypothetical protein